MTEFHFEERHPHEAGFATVFDQEIAPFLRESEAQRLAARQKGKKRVQLIGGAGLLLLLIVNLVPALDGGGLSFIIIIAAAIAAVAVYALAGKELNETVAGHVRPLLLDFLGDVQYIEKPPPGFIDIQTPRRLGLVRDHKTASFAQGLEGTWRGVSYRIANLVLKRQGKNQQVTVFDGIILSVETPDTMPTIVFRGDLDNKGAVTKALVNMVSKPGDGLERLYFPDEAVEDLYDVFTDDVARARDSIAPSFGRTLMAIAREAKGEDNPYISAVFVDRAFIALFDARKREYPWMDLDAFSTPLSRYDERLHTALHDMTLIRRMIDLLLDGANNEPT